MQNVMFMPHPMSQLRTLIVTASLVILTYKSMELVINFTWVLAMSPLMSEILSRSECTEVDVTYKSCFELPYLFNVVAFNYITMRCKLININ